MKLKKALLCSLLTLLIISCSTVRVATDYDTKADFSKYKTFAFYKKGIDKSTISDLDKKRIMRAIEKELIAKGMTISEKPDILVSLFTKSKERVDFNDGFYGGFGYPWYYGIGYSQSISRYIEGTLFIDIIDSKGKELIWQGVGTGALVTRNTEKKIARINEFVKEIMQKYPPKNLK